ncbi:MAG: hypothetical protein FJZ95_09720 [Chloroflexi bacterium]|nr:hypothetical protein [Chloroflexota bacterium]
MTSANRARFVEQHIVDCLRAAIVEANGEPEKAARLRAQAKLRLICMSDAEVWELAKRTCFPPKRSALEAYKDIKGTIEEYKATTDEWLDKTFGPISAGPAR